MRVKTESVLKFQGAFDMLKIFIEPVNNFITGEWLLGLLSFETFFIKFHTIARIYPKERQNWFSFFDLSQSLNKLKPFFLLDYQIKKMKKKHFKYINTLFVVIPMTLIMAFVGLIRNYGFGEDWPMKFLKAWSVMVPVAYFAAFIIIPNARKLAEKVASKS